ncbi:hypothetical protein K402DRAFT_320509, partial [Aulographum hederae CBS 113979]
LEWTVMSQTGALGGTYHSAADFREKTIVKLGSIMDPDTPLRMKLHNIIGGSGTDEWTTIEMQNEGKTKNGMEYNQKYAWCVRWSPLPEGKIVQVRAYLDSKLLDDVITADEENKIKKEAASEI